MADLDLGGGLRIPQDAVRFTFDRSGGPGGQNVNKVSTRATLWFDLMRCTNLSDESRNRIADALAGRIDHAGQLRIVAQSHRTQARNRRAAVERLAELLRRALRPRVRRVATRPTGASQERRRREKEQRSRIKRGRVRFSRSSSEE